ncbi:MULTISPECIES: hypothetical protein [Aerosakkonema]|uniref:hypothetical protein n=1 Tax=Aerosakkonema TaxID=1246629 RepID=UPI0035BC00B6
MQFQSAAFAFSAGLYSHLFCFLVGKCHLGMQCLQILPHRDRSPELPDPISKSPGMIGSERDRKYNDNIGYL